TRDESVASDAEPRVAVAVGIALGRDAAPSESPLAARATAIRGEIDRARVEAGQGELWIALGSPCGTLPEQTSDAGLGAAFAIAAADRTELALHGSGARAEAWAAGDGLGVVVHGPALSGESPEEHARRLDDALARSFAAEPLDRGAIARARARLLDA